MFSIVVVIASHRTRVNFAVNTNGGEITFIWVNDGFPYCICVLNGKILSNKLFNPVAPHHKTTQRSSKHSEHKVSSKVDVLVWTCGDDNPQYYLQNKAGGDIFPLQDFERLLDALDRFCGKFVKIPKHITRDKIT